MQIAEGKDYEKYRNQYPVIHIAFNDLPKNQLSYKRYIERIERRLIRDLKREYPQAEWEEDEGLADVFLDIYAEDDSARFIFVLDEWDFIFYPETNDHADGIILELKVDRTPDEAIRQIQDREYALTFRGKMAERKFYAGRVLGVGISYDRVEKKHHCQVVIL